MERVPQDAVDLGGACCPRVMCAHQFGAAAPHRAPRAGVAGELRYRAGKSRCVVAWNDQTTIASSNHFGLAWEICCNNWDPARERFVKLQGRYTGRGTSPRIGDRAEAGNRTSDKFRNLLVGAITQPADRKPTAHGLMYVMRPSPVSDDRERDARRPRRVTKRVQHQVHPVPLRQAAKEHNKRFTLSLDRAKQIGIGAVRDYRDVVECKRIGERLGESPRDWEQV